MTSRIGGGRGEDPAPTPGRSAPPPDLGHRPGLHDGGERQRPVGARQLAELGAALAHRQRLAGEAAGERVEDARGRAAGRRGRPPSSQPSDQVGPSSTSPRSASTSRASWQPAARARRPASMLAAYESVLAPTRSGVTRCGDRQQPHAVGRLRRDRLLAPDALAAARDDQPHGAVGRGRRPAERGQLRLEQRAVEAEADRAGRAREPVEVPARRPRAAVVEPDALEHAVAAHEAVVEGDPRDVARGHEARRRSSARAGAVVVGHASGTDYADGG